MTTSTGDTLNAATLPMGTAPEEPQLTEQEMRALLGHAGDGWEHFGRMRTLGLGGSGEVFSGKDPGLRRFLAVKILRPEYRSQRKLVESFIREARITAQIEHPNIVPVHRIGYSPEVGVFFTMKEIEGRDLRSIIRALRDKKPAADRFIPLNRRLEIFIAVCQGIAFAHSKGVIHCDLKPANVMVGNFGEVMIMDWGLSLYRNDRDCSPSGQKIDLARNSSAGLPEEPVRELPAGAVRVSGTPAFMSPEQASGQMDLIDEKSDIYGLGTILYCLLTLESAPIYPDRSTDDVLFDAARGRIIRPRRRAPLRAIPRELEAITMKALAFDRATRYESAEELLEDVRHFMEKFPVNAYRNNWFYKLKKLAVRRPLVPLTLLAAMIAGGGVIGVNALEMRSLNEATRGRVQHASMRADAYYKLATRTYRNMQRGIPAASESEFLRQSIEFANYTNLALEGLSLIELRKGFSQIRKREFLQLLCHLFRQQIELCHLTGNSTALQAATRQFQTRWQGVWMDIFETDPPLAMMIRQILRNRSGIVLKAPAAVSVVIRPEDPDRSLPGEWQSADADTLLNIPSGSYLLRAGYPDGQEIFFPVEAMAGKRVELDLQSLPAIPDGFAWIPGGVFQTGHAELQDGHVRHLPGFFIQKHEVLLKDYLAFWRQLKDPVLKKHYRGVYRDPGELGQYVWNEQGKLNAPFTEDMPVFGISGPAAEAYCRYRTEKTGLLHRLPTRLEWEKAARGVDGRRFVWGNRAVLQAAYTKDFPESDGGRARFAVPAGLYPLDRSVYGVWDMAGNLREMVRDPEDSGSVYRVMGGSFRLGHLHATTYHVGSTNNGVLDAGFRCVIELPQKAEDGNL